MYKNVINIVSIAIISFVISCVMLLAYDGATAHNQGVIDGLIEADAGVVKFAEAVTRALTSFDKRITDLEQ